jgi:hypothetical protein
MEKMALTSYNDTTKYITEFTDLSKKGHCITYQKRIVEATEDGK